MDEANSSAKKNRERFSFISIGTTLAIKTRQKKARCSPTSSRPTCSHFDLHIGLHVGLSYNKPTCRATRRATCSRSCRATNTPTLRFLF